MEGNAHAYDWLSNVAKFHVSLLNQREAHNHVAMGETYNALFVSEVQCLCLRSNRAAGMLSKDEFPHDNVPYSWT